MLKKIRCLGLFTFLFAAPPVKERMKQICIELDGAFTGSSLAWETPTSLREFPHVSVGGFTPLNPLVSW